MIGFSHRNKEDVHPFTFPVKVLTFNCGSSSVKYSVWEMPGAKPVCQNDYRSVPDSILTEYSDKRFGYAKKFFSGII
jgi:hypothetical protein